jgi:hypothetical protein
MPAPCHLTADLQALEPNELLADWRWLVREENTPILATAFGDLFLRDSEGRIHFLDLLCGELKLVAETEAGFSESCGKIEWREQYFVGHLIMELRKLHGPLPSGKCFSCKVPLFLGGKLEPENFRICDLLVHASVLGQLAEQSQALPGRNLVNGFAAEPKARTDSLLAKLQRWFR